MCDGNRSGWPEHCFGTSHCTMAFLPVFTFAWLSWRNLHQLQLNMGKCNLRFPRHLKPWQKRRNQTSFAPTKLYILLLPLSHADAHERHDTRRNMSVDYSSMWLARHVSQATSNKQQEEEEEEEEEQQQQQKQLCISGPARRRLSSKMKSQTISNRIKVPMGRWKNVPQ